MKILRRRVVAVALACASIAMLPAAAVAQAWPAKPVTIVVSFPPGGDTDALARLFAEKLSARIGQTVNVENRTGASGTIGNASVAKAPADGYTLLFTPNTITTATMVLRPGTGAAYDVLEDFTPIVMMGTQQLFVVVNTATGINSMADLVAANKGGKMPTYASPGSGSPMHILGELFNRSAGMKIQQVPYRGSGPAVIDLLGGHIGMFFTTLGPVSPHIASGKLRNLAVADAKRSPLAPDVPTLSELGFKDADVPAWQAFMAPKGLSPDIQRTLNGHFNEILKQPDVQARMTQLALLPAGGEPSVVRERVAGDHARYSKVIKELGIQAD